MMPAPLYDRLIHSKLFFAALCAMMAAVVYWSATH